MDKYQDINHSRWGVPPAVPPPSTAPNKFIYVKQDFFRPEPEKPSGKVLVNPHFKKNSMIYVNPNFSAICSVDAAVESPLISTKIHVNPAHVKPKIHVNPKVLKRQISPLSNKKPDRIISTRTKFIRVPSETTPKRRRTSSLHTKYKIVRSSNKENSLKVDKRTSINKRKYVYINRFPSISVMAKSVVLKQNPSLKRKGFVNINGIMYKKSPNSLKKQVPMNSSISKYRYVKKLSISSSSKLKIQLKPSEQSRRSLVKRFKVVRSKKVAKDRKLLHKCNMPCQIYRKFGKCKGKDKGTCFKVHNPDQIVLCTKFLQGACLNENCLLSHKVSHEKMPACKYYLEGLCSREDCPYLHVKISAKADICRDFVAGYCQKAAECDKRHQFLCPDFEKNRTCPKKRCPYPHGTVRSRKVQLQVAKKCSGVKNKKPPPVKNASSNKESSETEATIPNSNRYYDDDQKPQPKLDSDLKVAVGRPKLGTLPAFIPLFEDT